MKLFKIKKQVIKEVCQDIRVICDNSIQTIDKLQDNVSCMQDNVQELIRLNERQITLCQEMIDVLDKVGEKY